MAEPEFIPADTDPASRRSDPARNLAVVVYILQALSFFVGGITGLVGVIINYVKLDDVRNTWVERHFRWQIRTFWIGLLYCMSIPTFVSDAMTFSVLSLVLVVTSRGLSVFSIGAHSFESSTRWQMALTLG